MTSEKIIRDVRAECPCADILYCPLEKLVAGMSARLLEQHKCVERMKWLCSQIEGDDIGWECAYKKWVDEGYAALFARVYQEGMLHDEIFVKILCQRNLNSNLKPLGIEKRQGQQVAQCA